MTIRNPVDRIQSYYFEVKKSRGNKPITGTESGFEKAISAEIADKSDLNPLVLAINQQAAHTGITATIGSTAASVILTHSTGEDIEITSGVFFMDENRQQDYSLANNVPNILDQVDLY